MMVVLFIYLFFKFIPCVVLPGFSVRDTNLSAGGQGREHDHCPAALPPQGEPGGTEAGEAAHMSADWKNNAMEWVCVCCAVCF